MTAMGRVADRLQTWGRIAARAITTGRASTGAINCNLRDIAWRWPQGRSFRAPASQRGSI